MTAHPVLRTPAVPAFCFDGRRAATGHRHLRQHQHQHQHLSCSPDGAQRNPGIEVACGAICCAHCARRGQGAGLVLLVNLRLATCNCFRRHAMQFVAFICRAASSAQERSHCVPRNSSMATDNAPLKYGNTGFGLQFAMRKKSLAVFHLYFLMSLVVSGRSISLH